MDGHFRTGHRDGRWSSSGGREVAVVPDDVGVVLRQAREGGGKSCPLPVDLFERSVVEEALEDGEPLCRLVYQPL